MKIITYCIIIASVCAAIVGPVNVYAMNQAQDEDKNKEQHRCCLLNCFHRFYRLMPSRTTICTLRSANSRLFEAIAGESNMDAFLQALSDGAEVNQVDMDGWTPLHVAVFQGKAEKVKILLEAGVQVNQADVNRWTALSWAVSHGKTEIVKILLEAGAYVNQADADGWAPLHWAVTDGNYEMVRTLIAAGADVNLEDTRGFTPFYRAFVKNNVTIGTILAFNKAVGIVPFSDEFASMKVAVEKARDAQVAVADHCLVQQEVVKMFAHKKLPAELVVSIYTMINPFAVIKEENEDGLLRQLMKEQILKNRTERRAQQAVFAVRLERACNR